MIVVPAEPLKVPTNPFTSNREEPLKTSSTPLPKYPDATLFVYRELPCSMTKVPESAVPNPKTVLWARVTPDRSMIAVPPLLM
jgi:hypothetical protein